MRTKRPETSTRGDYGGIFPRMTLLRAMALVATVALAHPRVGVSAPASPCDLVTGGVYVGTYTCAQGDTEMRLTITDVDGPRTLAQGDFYHAPSGTRGSYRLRGVCIGRTRRLLLSPAGWVDQPPGYRMVGMSGTVTPGGAAFFGRMNAAECGGFSFARQ